MAVTSTLKYADTLPDPDYGVDYSGLEDNTIPYLGQPFKSVSLKSTQPTETDHTISGKTIYRNRTYSKWSISITYNPMTRDAFEPIYRFLMEKRGRLRPFLVSLPQYKRPQDNSFSFNTEFTSSVTTNNALYKAGSTSIDVNYPGLWVAANNYNAGLPSVGDVFTVRGEFTDTLHTKAYMVTRVETTLDGEYEEGNQPSDTYVRVHFTPGLQRDIPVATDLNFFNPQFQVVQVQDITEYSLNTEGLYTFSIRLEEAFY